MRLELIVLLMLGGIIAVLVAVVRSRSARTPSNPGITNFCTKCGTAFAAGSVFCGACGAPRG